MPLISSRAPRLSLLALVACVAVLVSDSTAQAYVLKQTASGARVRWTVDRIPLQLSESLEHVVTHRQAASAVTMASDAWRGLGGPEVFISTEAAENPGFDGDHGVFAPETWPHAPHLLAVTVTTYEEVSGNILDVDILVNREHDFALLAEAENANTDFDLAAVLTHEMGHALGLGETDADPLATMWPRIAPGDVHQRSVETDDEAGLISAYENAVLHSASGCASSTVAIHQFRRPIPLSMGLLLALIMLYGGWRWYQGQAMLRRDDRHAQKKAYAPGLFLGAVVALLALPNTDTTPNEPVQVRASRALHANERPDAEREAILAAAVDDPEVQVRASALMAILNEPQREDADFVSQLTQDSDSQVARRAIAALDHTRRAAPSHTIGPHQDNAEERMIPFTGTEVHTGEVRHVQSWEEDGQIWSRTEIASEDETYSIIVEGGCLDGVCQEFGEALVPVVGERLLFVIPADDATLGTAWARIQHDVAYGGWLGEGPAIVTPLASAPSI